MKLDHIAIATDNFAETVDFYQNSLGLNCEKIEKLPKRGIIVAFFKAGQSHIEIIGELSPKSEITNFLQKRGGGLHHIAFKTNKLNDKAVEMQKKGVKFTTNQPKSGANNKEVIFIHPKSSFGSLLELIDE